VVAAGLIVSNRRKTAAKAGKVVLN
jgi:hypothetical protein